MSDGEINSVSPQKEDGKGDASEIVKSADKIENGKTKKDEVKKKDEEKAETKTEKKIVDKAEEKSDEKIKDKTDVKTEEKTEVKTNDKTEVKPKEKTEVKPKEKTKEKKKEKSKEKPKEKPKEETEEETETKEKTEEEEEESEHEVLESKTESPKRTYRKRKKVVQEEYDSDESLPPGLLERPVIIESGKREKKQVDRLSMYSAPHEKKKVDIPEGRGVKLATCERIELKISRTKAEDLRPLHRLMFSKVGTLNEIKRNIRQFSGFAFTKEDKEYNKRILVLSKLFLSSLKQVCDVLDIEKSGNKDTLIERIMTFLMAPESSGKKLPQAKKRRSSKGGDKKGVKRKRSVTKKKEKDEEEDEDSEEEVEENKEESEEENKEESEEEEKPPKKKVAKIEKPKEKKTTNNVKNDKKEKSTPKSDKKKKKVVRNSDIGSDDDKSTKRTSPPNNDEIKELVKKILDGANLEEVTMKTVVKQVYAKYPSFDLSDKKDFIKSTVKQLIS